MAAIGSAIHGYLATPYETLPEAARLESARRQMERWGVAGRLSAAEVVAAGDAWRAFVEEHFPGAAWLREWPVTLVNEKGQHAQGWIDLLLDTPEGFVLVDHKSYPGGGIEAYLRKEHAPQLALYRDAVLRATGRPVLAAWVHLPVQGKVYRLGFDA